MNEIRTINVEKLIEENQRLRDLIAAMQDDLTIAHAIQPGRAFFPLFAYTSTHEDKKREAICPVCYCEGNTIATLHMTHIQEYCNQGHEYEPIWVTVQGTTEKRLMFKYVKKEERIKL